MYYKQSDLNDLIKTNGRASIGVILPFAVMALTCGGAYFLI